MNKRYLTAIALVAAFAAGGTLAVDRDASLYVGVKSCKMCHKKPEEGEQFTKWQDGPHAKAYEKLGTPEAKEAAKKLGIDDPQKSGKCLKCHSTAYNFTETLAATEIPVEEGISCESCHGPGKNYKKKEIMKDKEQAKAGGLLVAKDGCVNCHNDKAIGGKADRYTLKDGTKVAFDFDQAYEKIKHPLPKK